HRSVRLVILVGLAIDQIAQSGLSSLSVIYYSAQLFSTAHQPGAQPEPHAQKAGRSRLRATCGPVKSVPSIKP
ncbi:hypothetical protein, partial [Serratia nevei]|uniref:hypothetical protein n=1 Tax=Serratia nevei TaxID=2703794 RepID=UPI00254B93AA